MTDIPSWVALVLALSAPVAGLLGVWLGGRISARETRSERDARNRERLDDLRWKAYSTLFARVTRFQAVGTSLRRQVTPGDMPSEELRQELDLIVADVMQSLYEARMATRTKQVRWHLQILIASMVNAFTAWTGTPDALESWEDARSRVDAALDPLADLISSELAFADFEHRPIGYFDPDSEDAPQAPPDDLRSKSTD